MHRLAVAVFIAIIMMLVSCQPQTTDSGGATSMSTRNNNSSETYDAAFNEYVKLLFFDESLKAVASRLENVDVDWANTLKEANTQAQQGNSQQAITTLRTLADNDDLEIGVRLWARNGL